MGSPRSSQPDRQVCQVVTFMSSIGGNHSSRLGMDLVSTDIVDEGIKNHSYIRCVLKSQHVWESTGDYLDFGELSAVVTLGSSAF